LPPLLPVLLPLWLPGPLLRKRLKKPFPRAFAANIQSRMGTPFGRSHGNIKYQSMSWFSSTVLRKIDFSPEWFSGFLKELPNIK
jgi:hypothetical protein